MWFLERETPIRFKMQDEGGPLVAKQQAELGALEESESKRLHEVRYSTHVASSHTTPLVAVGGNRSVGDAFALR